MSLGDELIKVTNIQSRPWEKVLIDYDGPIPDGHYIFVGIDNGTRYPVV